MTENIIGFKTNLKYQKYVDFRKELTRRKEVTVMKCWKWKKNKWRWWVSRHKLIIIENHGISENVISSSFLSYKSSIPLKRESPLHDRKQNELYHRIIQKLMMYWNIKLVKYLPNLIWVLCYRDEISSQENAFHTGCCKHKLRKRTFLELQRLALVEIHSRTKGFR